MNHNKFRQKNFCSHYFKNFQGIGDMNIDLANYNVPLIKMSHRRKKEQMNTNYRPFHTSQMKGAFTSNQALHE